MTERQALALLIIGAVAITLLIVAFQEAAPQPYLPWVAASVDKTADNSGLVAEQRAQLNPKIRPICQPQPVNPCLTMVCNPAGPFGGVDPDAGERDNRRIA